MPPKARCFIFAAAVPIMAKEQTALLRKSSTIESRASASAGTWRYLRLLLRTRPVAVLAIAAE